MTITRDYEAPVRVRDVFFHILYRWRSILAVAVCCGLLLGGIQYWSEVSAHGRGEATREEERYARDLETYRTNVEKYETESQGYQNLLEERIAYWEKSLLMQLDPAAVWTAERKYRVAGGGEKTLAILGIYGNAMFTDHDAAALEEAFGSGNYWFVSEVAGVTLEGEEILLTARAATEEAARKGLNYLTEKTEAAGARARAIGDHTLELVGERVLLGAMEELLEKKKTANEDINWARSMTDKSRKSLESVIAGGEPKAPGSAAVSRGLTGAGLGLLIMIAVYLGHYLLRGKLRRGEEMAAPYGVPIYGEMNRSGARKSGRGMDGLIEKWQFRKDRKDDATVWDNAAALVRAALAHDAAAGSAAAPGASAAGVADSKDAAAGLLLAGTAGEAVLAGAAAELSARLGSEIKIEVAAAFPDRPGAAEAAGTAAAVLWVEEKHVSRTEKIREAAVAFEAAGANVIGAMIV